MTKSLKEKAIKPRIVSGDASQYLEDSMRFKYEDVIEAVLEYLFVIDYIWTFDSDCSIEADLNKTYCDIMNKYGLNPYDNYSNKQLANAIFGDWTNK